MEADAQVLRDAAAMLRKAANRLVKHASTTACTPEYERKVFVEVRANIDGALARIPDRRSA